MSTTARELCLLALAALAALVPLLAAEIPPLTDYPNHLARVHILAHLCDHGGLDAFYRLDPVLAPNLAIDLVAGALATFLPTPLAGKVFVAATLLLLLAATAALARALRHPPGQAALLSALLLYSFVLVFGFLNYLFGLGLMLATLAAWVALREHGAALRIAVTAPLALLVLVSHLMPFVMLVLVLLAREAPRLTNAWRNQRTLHDLVPFLALLVAPAILLFASPRPTAGLHGLTWPHLGKKLNDVIRLFVIGQGSFDAIYTVLVAILLVLLLLRARPRLAPGMGRACLALAACWAIAPEHAGSTSYVEARMPLAVFLLLAATVRLELRRPRERVLFLSLLLFALSFRTAHVAWQWHDQNVVLQDLDHELARIPDGATVYSFDSYAVQHRGRRLWNPPLRHAACLAALHHAVFVPLLFAVPGQQPLAFQSRNLADISALQIWTLQHMEEEPPLAFWITWTLWLHRHRSASTPSARAPAAHPELDRAPAYAILRWLGARPALPESVRIVREWPGMCLIELGD